MTAGHMHILNKLHLYWPKFQVELESFGLRQRKITDSQEQPLKRFLFVCTHLVGI